MTATRLGRAGLRTLFSIEKDESVRLLCRPTTALPSVLWPKSWLREKRRQEWGRSGGERSGTRHKVSTHSRTSSARAGSTHIGVVLVLLRPLVDDVLCDRSAANRAQADHRRVSPQDHRSLLPPPARSRPEHNEPGASTYCLGSTWSSAAGVFENARARAVVSLAAVRVGGGRPRLGPATETKCRAGVAALVDSGRRWRNNERRVGLRLMVGLI